MNKHTKGPWIVTDEDLNCHVIRGSEEHHMAGDTPYTFRSYVATTWGGFNEANARLISSAPDLLEALQSLCVDELLTQDKWDNARAAVKKATGEQS